MDRSVAGVPHDEGELGRSEDERKRRRRAVPGSDAETARPESAAQRDHGAEPRQQDQSDREAQQPRAESERRN